jgi:phage tail sheath protein FI
LFLTLIRWIEHNMHEVVFEPNDPRLWDQVRDRLGAHCNELFRRGALKGSGPGEAFFVKCDAETNPLTVREAGQLICEVGLAPLAPAEFIVVRITQSVAGATAVIPAGA